QGATPPGEPAPKRAIEGPPKQETAPQPVSPQPSQPQVRRVAAQDVMVVSSPGGATATLDGNPAIACTTPCTLQAPPGRHSVSMVLPGHEIERREISVGNAPIERPPVVIRTAAGTLMLSSVPSGASATVAGQRPHAPTPP